MTTTYCLIIRDPARPRWRPLVVHARLTSTELKEVLATYAALGYGPAWLRVSQEPMKKAA